MFTLAPLTSVCAAVSSEVPRAFRGFSGMSVDAERGLRPRALPAEVCSGMRTPFLIFLVACTGSIGDTGLDSTVVLASPPSTPEVGELATYEALFTGESADRVEWFIDEVRIDWEDNFGGDRAEWDYAAESESFSVGVKAFYGLEFVEDAIGMTATPNTPPAVTLVQPTTISYAPDDVVTMLAEVVDVTVSPLTCVWSVGGTDLRTGEPDDEGRFSSAWAAVAGSWELEIICTDSLGLSATQAVTVSVQ